MARVERPAWAPEGIDLTRPSAARVYDFYLGGFHNFAVDREMGRQALALWPELPQIMRANRAFLRRAVRYTAAAGIRQFLDVGSGIPTAGNVHTVAQRAVPDARVVYVDNDPVAVAHSRAILGDDPRTAVIQADLRRPGEMLRHPDLVGLLDLTEPVGVLMVAVLHFVADEDDPYVAVARIREALAPGSLLAISHATHDGQPELTSSHQTLYRRTATPMTMRGRDAVHGFFDGFELVEPGLVYMAQWRPDPGEDLGEHPERYPAWVGVGRRS